MKTNTTGAANQPAEMTTTTTKSHPANGTGIIPWRVKVDPDVLAMMNRESKRLGITRSQYVSAALARHNGKLETIIRFDEGERWKTGTPTGLFMGPHDVLYLGQILHFAKMVTIKEALEWFVRCNDFADSCERTPADLERIAAAALAK